MVPPLRESSFTFTHERIFQAIAPRFAVANALLIG
jgi:hypothetical protein